MDGFINGAKAASSAAVHWASHNPKTAAAVGSGCAIAAVPALITSTVVLPIVGAVGFGSGGVAAGSAAAAAQAGIGNVVAGTAFAWFQSLGAGGAALGAVNTAVQAAGGTTVAGAAVRYAKEFMGR